MQNLTKRQQAVFDFIVKSYRDGGYIPTVRQIAAAFGFASPNAVVSHLIGLEKKGYINRRRGEARNIEIAPDYLLPMRGIPIVGKIAAGQPLEAVENLEGYLDLDNIYRREEHYALRVKGDSMIEAGIWDGDYVIVHQVPRVESGEIGVAIIENEATVKRFHWREDGFLVLIPANEYYQPIPVDPQSSFRVGGRVVGVHRII
ncbi:MAG: transcriptional repressor LexA [Planctomycetota bacterium]|jgi:repressor LexA|nr:transcriptional repressor LexA [Planctomycetota bacterium]